jgi:chromosome segregation ATPase
MVLRISKKFTSAGHAQRFLAAARPGALGDSGQRRLTLVSTARDDFEARLASLEREVSQLREQLALSSADSAAARVLAVGADHDVGEVRAELRAHTQALNAIRETQLEQGQQIRELGWETRDLSREMRAGFATVSTGIAQITALLTQRSEPEKAN